MTVIILGLMAIGVAAAQTPVSITDNGAAYVMTNAYVTATVSKVTGDLVSLKYKGFETMGYVSGHHAGYWEQNPSGAARLEAKLTIDPAANGGERGEVSVKGWSDGESLDAHRRRDPAVVVEHATDQLEGREVGPPPGSTREANAGARIMASTPTRFSRTSRSMARRSWARAAMASS
jgi:hypothetical protein